MLCFIFFLLERGLFLDPVSFFTCGEFQVLKERAKDVT